jgi:DNA polymerase-3 subunit chi
VTEVLFYHLERSRLEDTLPGLLERTLARGQKALVRCGTPEGMEALDSHLWAFSDESFLPHGRAGEPREEEQPVLLSLGEEAPNRADVLFLVDGAPAVPAVMERFTRAVLMFSDDAAGLAREAWKAIKDAGLDATYWKQTPQGRWVKGG